MNKETIINKLIKEVEEHKNIIKKAYNIDQKYYSIKIDIEKIKQTIRKTINNLENKEKQGKQSVVLTNGNPYIILILALKAICTNTNVIIDSEETMLATNNILIEIIEQVLKKEKIKTEIELERNIEIEKLIQYEKQGKQIIITNDKAKYTTAIKQGINKAKYIPICEFIIYCPDEKLIELKNNCIQYCMENQLGIEEYTCEEVEEFIDEVKIDCDGRKIMVLTQDKQTIEKIQKELQDEQVFFNKNILINIEEELIKEDIY